MNHWFYEALRMAGALAGNLHGAVVLSAVALMQLVTASCVKLCPAMHTFASFRLRYFVLPAGNRSRHKLDTRRRPKKIPSCEENSISRRLKSVGFSCSDRKTSGKKKKW
jgi:hypothetical protein